MQTQTQTQTGPDRPGQARGVSALVMSCPIPPCPVPRAPGRRWTSQRVRVSERSKDSNEERERDASGETDLGCRLV
jgi:hypothetical protein